MTGRYTWAAMLLLAATPALAGERDYCPTRPGLNTTPCTIVPGRVSVETAITDWTLENEPDQRTDTILIGDTLVRVGVADRLELLAGWTPYGHVRTRNNTSGAVDSAGRVGDVLLGAKLNLAHPDGQVASVALQPFVTLPVGRTPVGAGTWAAGVVLPVSFDLGDKVALQATGELDAAPDEDAHGRHLAYSGVAGLGLKLSRAVTLTLEGEVLRDEDPSGHTTQALASASLAWMARDDLQLDTGAVAGLDRDAPDVELYLGISHRF